MWPENYQQLFWEQYPRRVDKKKAMQKLDVIRKAGKVPFSDIISGVEGYARHVSGTEPQFIKHPATWLHGECWANEYSPARRSGESAFIAGMARVAARYGVSGGSPGRDGPVSDGLGATGQLLLVAPREDGHRSPQDGSGGVLHGDILEPPGDGERGSRGGF